MRKILLLVALIGSYLQGNAAETDVLTQSTQITPTDLKYYDRGLATNENGKTYILLACPSSESGMAYRLQITDKDGSRTLGRGGKVISAERNRTWTTWNQYLQTDNSGNAFVGVQDMRHDESKTGYTIYKYSETGEKLWNGTSLNGGVDYYVEAGLAMACTNDGGLLCAYCYTDTEKEKDFVHIEKLDKDGNTAWMKDIFQTGSFSNPYPFLINTKDGNIMALWVDNGNIDANIIDAQTGNLQFEDNKKVYTNGFGSSKVMEVIKIKKGPDNGALISVVDGNLQGRLVYVKSDLSLGLNGDTKGVLLDKSENIGFASTNPETAYSDADKTFSCLYKSFDKENKNNQAVYFQKLKMDGTEMWENGGKAYVALQTDNQYGYFSIHDLGDGKSAAFYLKYDNLTNMTNGEVAVFSKDGEADDVKEFADMGNTKVELWTSEILSDSKVIAAWDEKVSGGYSLFMNKADLSSVTAIESPADVAYTGNRKYYSVNGVQLTGLEKGINIVRLYNGKVVKIAR